jgi:hypothetical protein
LIMAFDLYRASLAEQGMKSSIESEKYQFLSNQAQQDMAFKMGQINSNTAIKMNEIQGKYNMMATAINAAGQLGMAAMQNYYQLKVQENNFQLGKLKLQGELAGQSVQIGMLQEENTRKKQLFSQGQADRAYSAAMIPKIAKFHELSLHGSSEDISKEYQNLLTEMDRVNTEVYGAHGVKGILNPEASQALSAASNVLQSNKIKTPYGDWKVDDVKAILLSPAGRDPKLVAAVAEAVRYNPNVSGELRGLASSSTTLLLKAGPAQYEDDPDKLYSYIEMMGPKAKAIDPIGYESAQLITPSNGYTLFDQADALHKIVAGGTGVAGSVTDAGASRGLATFTTTAADVATKGNLDTVKMDYGVKSGKELINNFFNGSLDTVGFNAKYTPGAGASNLDETLYSGLDWNMNETAKLALVTEGLRDYLVEMDQRDPIQGFTNQEQIKIKDAIAMLDAINAKEMSIKSKERGAFFPEASAMQGTEIFGTLLPNNAVRTLSSRLIGKLNRSATLNRGTFSRMPAAGAAAAIANVAPPTQTFAAEPTLNK